MLTVERRVQKGMELLDEQKPDWRESIHIESLNIGTIHTCVLGQVFGNYFRGKDVLNLNDYEGGDARDLGFIAVYSDDHTIVMNDVNALNVEWKRVLSQEVIETC